MIASWLCWYAPRCQMPVYKAGVCRSHYLRWLKLTWGDGAVVAELAARRLELAG